MANFFRKNRDAFFIAPLALAAAGACVLGGLSLCRFVSGSVVMAGEHSETSYGDVVRQYEEKYGTLQFYENEYSTNYTGVFLLKTIDFDGNGVEELMIGYSVPYSGGIEYCAWPALDVWTLDNGKPVCLYEGAMVTQSDIGRHCLYATLDDVTYLVTGWAGSDYC